MNNHKFIITLCILMPFLLPQITSGQSKKITFNTTDIEWTDVKMQSCSYEKISFRKAFHSGEVGKPDLPVFYYRFYIPKGKETSKVAFCSTSKTELQLHADLFPSQHPVKVSEIADDTIFDAPDTAVYGKDALYPKEQAFVMHSDFVDGTLKLRL